MQIQLYLSLALTKLSEPVQLLEEETNDDDPEYNFLAEIQEDDKEDFRNDRAVKVSSKHTDMYRSSVTPVTSLCSGWDFICANRFRLVLKSVIFHFVT